MNLNARFEHPKKEKNFQISEQDRIFIFISIFLAAFMVFISYKNLGNCFYWDDFHLIREFSIEELKSVWMGNWDPDNLEVAGYRPLLPYFNHTRYLLFGENLAAHRVFLVSLFLVIIIAWGRFLLKLGLNNYTYLVTSLLVLSARNSGYHFNWITDGLHLLQGILFIASLWLIYFAVFSKNKSRIYVFSGLSLLIYAISLLVKEDAVIGFGIVILFWCYLIYSNPNNHKKMYILHLFIYGLAGTFLTLLLISIGRHFVPDRPYGINPQGYFTMLKYTITLAGFRGGSEYYIVAIAPFLLVFHAWLLSKFQNRKIDTRIMILFGVFLGSMMIGSTPGFLVWRSNLTLFSTIFYCSWIGTGLFIFLDLIKQNIFVSRTVKALFTVLLIPIIIENTTNSILLQETTAHPTCNIYVDTPDYLWGRYTAGEIPETRKEKLLSDLHQLGLTPDNYTTEIPKIMCEAIKAGRQHPDPDGQVFFPSYPYFADDEFGPAYSPYNCSE